VKLGERALVAGSDRIEQHDQTVALVDSGSRARSAHLHGLLAGEKRFDDQHGALPVGRGLASRPWPSILRRPHAAAWDAL